MQLLDDLKEKRISSSHWKRLWTCRKTDSKMNGSEMLRKPVVINTILSPEDRAGGLSYLPTPIFRREKIIKFESNTTCILNQMSGLCNRPGSVVRISD
jgi:hypothetical protein